MLNKVLIDILRSALTQTPISLPKEIDFNKLYASSDLHDISSMVSIALRNSGYEVTEKFKKSEILALYKAEQQKFDFEAFSKILNDNNIPFILLKGSVISEYYPQEYMRTSRDVDVLVYEYDIAKIFELLSQKLSYKPRIDPNDHHRSMNTPSGMHIEFHYSLSNDEYLPVKDAFNNAYEFDGNLILDNKSFFTYHIIHMAEHFKNGGCGIRSIMDLWVMQYKMNFNFDFEVLKSINLEKFAKSMIELSNVWFGDKNGVTKQHNELTKSIEDFIISGGSFGNSDNKITVSRGTQSSFSYIFNRFFLPFNRMKNMYPVLKKFPILTPVFWFVRLFTSVFKGHSKKIINEVSFSKNISEDMIKKGEFLCKELNI